MIFIRIFGMDSQEVRSELLETLSREYNIEKDFIKIVFPEERARVSNTESIVVLVKGLPSNVGLAETFFIETVKRIINKYWFSGKRISFFIDHGQAITMEDKEQSVAELEIDTRLKNILRRYQIVTLENLARDFSKIKKGKFMGIGRKSIRQIEQILKERGLIE